MSGPFAPTDDLVGPIANQIASLIGTQIPSIAHVYTELPDRPPADNSVMLAFARGRLLHEYSGKAQWELTYTAMHVFVRRGMSATLQTAYQYVTPWINFLASWPNQRLGGLSEEVSATQLTILQRVESGQPMVVLAVNFNVTTVLNIPTT